MLRLECNVAQVDHHVPHLFSDCLVGFVRFDTYLIIFVCLLRVAVRSEHMIESQT